MEQLLVATLQERPKIVLLVSCKLLSGRAEPAHVQEWAAVVETMNKYSDGQTETRIKAFGQTDEGRLFTVSFTMRNRKIRVISARNMSRKERQAYEAQP